MTERFVIMNPGETWGYVGEDAIKQCMDAALKELSSINNPIEAAQRANNCESANLTMIEEEKRLIAENKKEDKNYRLERLERSLIFFRNVRSEFIKQQTPQLRFERVNVAK